jgi:hypothetical protein
VPRAGAGAVTLAIAAASALVPVFAVTGI